MVDPATLDSWLKGGSFSSHNLPAIANWLLQGPECPKYQTVLDAGCGNGELLRLLLRGGWNRLSLYGCDIEPGHVELARERTGLGESIVEADLSIGNPFRPLGVHVIVAISWLHRDWRARYAIGCSPNPVDDPTIASRALNVINASLLPGGHLIYDWRSDEGDGGSKFHQSLLDAGFVVHDRFYAGYPYPTWVMVKT